MPIATAAGAGLETTGLAIVQDPDLRRLAGYWLGLRAGRPMPARRDIDPTAIPWALTRIYLLDYEADARRFRYRLAGDEICRLFERPSLKGLTFADFMAAGAARYIEGRLLALVDRAAVLHMAGMVYFAVDRIVLGERLILPLSDGGDERVTGLLGMTVCQWHARDRPPRPRRAKSTHIALSALN